MLCIAEAARKKRSTDSGKLSLISLAKCKYSSIYHVESEKFLSLDCNILKIQIIARKWRKSLMNVVKSKEGVDSSQMGRKYIVILIRKSVLRQKLKQTTLGTSIPPLATVSF